MRRLDDLLAHGHRGLRRQARQELAGPLDAIALVAIDARGREHPVEVDAAVRRRRWGSLEKGRGSPAGSTDRRLLIWGVLGNVFVGFAIPHDKPSQNRRAPAPRLAHTWLPYTPGCLAGDIICGKRFRTGPAGVSSSERPSRRRAGALASADGSKRRLFTPARRRTAARRSLTSRRRAESSKSAARAPPVTAASECRRRGARERSPRPLRRRAPR